MIKTKILALINFGSKANNMNPTNAAKLDQ